jgi:MFS family permease
MSDASARWSLIFANIGHAYAHLFMLIYPTVVLVLDTEFGLSYSQLLTLAFPGFVLFGALALPAGWLGDRWSALGMMAVFFIGTGVSSVLTGFAQTPWQLGAGLAAIGAFAAIYHPVGLAWIVRVAFRRGKALGFNGLIGGIGIASAPLVAGSFAELMTWRAAFIIPGLIGIATGLAFIYLVKTGLLVVPATDRKIEAEPARRDRVRVFMVLAVTVLFGGLIYQSLAVAMPKVFADGMKGITQGTVIGVGGMVTLVYLFGGLAQIVGGHMADRYPLKNVYLVSYILLAPVLFIAAGTEELALLLAALAVVFINVGSLPAENTLMARYAPGRWRNTVFGAKFVLTLGVSALGVPLVAFIYGLGQGFHALFVALSGVAVVVAVAAVFLPPEPKAETAPAPRTRPSGGETPAE